MRGAVLCGAGGVRFEQRDEPRILKPTDAIIRLSATCRRGVAAPLNRCRLGGRNATWRR